MDLAVTAMDGIAADPAFPVPVLGLLCDELDAAGAVWQRVDWRTGDSDLLPHGFPDVWVPPLLDATRSLRRTHPLLVACAHGDLAPQTAQEAAGGGLAWQRSPSRRFLSTLVASPQIVSVGLRGGSREVCGVALARSGADFTPAGVGFLTEVQPVLQALDRHVTRLRQWCEAVPAGAARAAAEVGLTSREVEVLGLVAEGLTAAAASRRLGCSTRTVHKHVAHLFRKLQVHDRLGAVLEAQRLGLVPLPHATPRAARSRHVAMPSGVRASVPVPACGSDGGRGTISSAARVPIR